MYQNYMCVNNAYSAYFKLLYFLISMKLMSMYYIRYIGNIIIYNIHSTNRPNLTYIEFIF